MTLVCSVGFVFRTKDDCSYRGRYIQSVIVELLTSRVL
jgi:hypothetical protein